MTDDTKAHVLYRFYSATGQLLYVGITMNPPQRFKNHRDSKEWWSEVSGITVENYDTREDLAKAERRAIQVEHPLHNVVHTKGKAKPQVQAQEPVEPPTDLFPPAAPTYSLESLFNRKYRDTRYGYMTDEDYEKRVEAERAKQQTRWDCPLCDSMGYRNGYVCNHIDSGGDSRLGQAQWRLRKERLRVVNGGDA